MEEELQVQVERREKQEQEQEQEEEEEEVIKVLEVLKQASHHLHSNPSGKPLSGAIKALLELETQSDTILSDPNLSHLSHHLSYLKTLVDTLHKIRGHSLRSFLRRRVSIHHISRVAESIESELQAWIDRELVDSLVKAFHEDDSPDKDVLIINLLTQFQDRVSKGFDLVFQDLLLKSRLFSELETILTNTTHSSIKLREEAAFSIHSLIMFNKNVFVGQVLMGPTTKALISISSTSSLKVLCSLIKSIKSPLVDEIESNHLITTIIGYMTSSDPETRVIGFDCVLEIGYYGRKEAVQAMIDAKVVEKLVDLQRSEMGGDLIEESCYLEKHPFASCVARFAVQLEVGEGLRQREKRAFKQEILNRVKDASLSHAQAATIQAQVLWGSFS